MLFVSAGFDAAAGDPLAGLLFTPSDYAWLTTELCNWADRSCEGRLVSTLEGGYELGSLAACASAHIEALMAG
jgi:acetoin utilization deacetylase AcuC-like enzyme